MLQKFFTDTILLFRFMAAENNKITITITKEF
jgi:hypothetical protein